MKKLLLSLLLALPLVAWATAPTPQGSVAVALDQSNAYTFLKVSNDGYLLTESAPAGTAGGVLSGTYPNPVFAVSGSVANDFSGSSGTFLTSTGAVTIGPGAVSVTGIPALTSTARTSGTAAYFTVTPPADTGLTASTASIGFNLATATRTWADGTVAAQYERFFAGPTYNKTTSAATFTDVFNLGLTPPIAGTGVTFTRKHTLGIVDSTSAASSITGGLIVAAALGTTGTSTGIGGGNINTGGNITAGGTLSVTGHVTVEGVTSTGATGTGGFVFSDSPTFTTTPAAPTASAGDNSTALATTAFVTLAANADTLGSIAGADSAAGAQTYTNRIGRTIFTTAAAAVRTYTLPNATTAAYKGTLLTVYVVTGTNHVNLQPYSGQHFVLAGVPLTANHYIQAGTSAAGNYISMFCDGATWVELGYSGTWADAASP